MPAYIPITEAQTDPGAPGTSELWKQWRDNPIAIAEGAVGAPRVQFPALDPSMSTVGGLGSVAFLGRSISPGVYANPGDSVSGANLRYASIQSTTTATQVQLSGASPTGVWRCMGFLTNASGADANAATLWVRVS